MFIFTVDKPSLSLLEVTESKVISTIIFVFFEYCVFYTLVWVWGFFLAGGVLGFELRVYILSHFRDRVS
jgi:hypothetical protein